MTSGPTQILPTTDTVAADVQIAQPTTPKAFTVGQTLWQIQRRSWGRTRGDMELVEITVTGVGRKWVTFKNNWETARFDPAEIFLGGWEVDAGEFGCSASVFPSIQAYEETEGRKETAEALMAALKDAPYAVPFATLKTWLSQVKGEG